MLPAGCSKQTSTITQKLSMVLGRRSAGGGSLSHLEDCISVCHWGDAVVLGVCREEETFL